MEPRKFNPSATHPARALQAWQILIGAESNRQTFTYQGLARLMYGREAQGVLAQVLGHIAYWCRERSLPELNSIVVRAIHGTPGHGIPLQAEHTDAEREEVYKVEWYDIWPPTEAELDTAYKSSRQQISN